MPKDFDNYKNMSSNNTNTIGNNSNQSYRADKRSTYKTVDPDINGAKKAYDDIFNYAKKSATDYNNFYVKSTGKSLRTVSNMTLSAYKELYKSLESMHSTYLKGVLDREFNAANQVAAAWSNARSGSTPGSPNTNLGGNGNYNTSDMKNIVGSIDKAMKNYNDANEEIMEEAADNMAEETGSRVSGIGKELLKVAKQFLDIWLQRFQRGIDNIYNTYENTYTNVSVLMAQNQQQYMQWQTATVQDIRSRGLADNVAISTVMDTLDKVVNMGVSGRAAQDKALSDSINKTLNPFVDTMTDAYTDLQLVLGHNFTDNLTGMTAYLKDVAGSSRVFKNSINEVVTKLEPVQLYAQKQLLSGEEYALVEELVNNGLMTTSQAVELVSQASDVVSDQYGALTNGNTAQAMAVARGATGSVSDAVISMLEAASILQSSNALSQGAAINAFGVGGWLGQSSNVNAMVNAARNFNRGSRTAYDYNRQLMGNFASGMYTTATAGKNIWAENTVLPVAQFKMLYPDAYDILSKILATLVTIAGSNLLNSASSWFSKSGGGQSLFGKSGLFSQAVSNGTSTGLGSGLSEGVKTGVSSAFKGGLNSTASAGALVVGGTIVAVEGGKQINKASSDAKKGIGTNAQNITQGVGGAVAVGGGATAAVAGGLVAAGVAAGPVGWIALGVGALGLAVATVTNQYK